MTQVLFLELNELNMRSLSRSDVAGRFPNLNRLIDGHGLSETTSETGYQELEPWIQWVSAHTGLTYREHGIFRLGDICQSDVPQIWEVLERQGLRVGAISPMNAVNRLQAPAFFVPDPWTASSITAGPLLRRLFDAIVQTVNDNAQARLSPASTVWLLAGVARYARARNYDAYIQLASNAASKPWNKAMFLDLLLADLFVAEVRRTKPQFASLFLNSAAHIQHHYMFNSFAYEGDQQNPEWYVAEGTDPVSEVYELYDRVLGQVISCFPDARIMLATGLHQDPHPQLTFYWRLKNHRAALERLGVPFSSVEPRMSRDFLIRCESEQQARRAAEILASVRALDGRELFEVDNRGMDIFVELVWPDDIGPEFQCMVGSTRYDGFADDVAFVAIKNGKHNGVGYFADSGAISGQMPACFPLTEIPERICDALNVSWENTGNGPGSRPQCDDEAACESGLDDLEFRSLASDRQS